MITEITDLHRNLDDDHKIRLILTVPDWEVTLTSEDNIIPTDSGLLRILRNNGNWTIVNPQHIACVCIAKRSAYL